MAELRETRSETNPQAIEDRIAEIDLLISNHGEEIKNIYGSIAELQDQRFVLVAEAVGFDEPTVDFLARHRQKIKQLVKNPDDIGLRLKLNRTCYDQIDALLDAIVDNARQQRSDLVTERDQMTSKETRRLLSIMIAFKPLIGWPAIKVNLT